MKKTILPLFLTLLLSLMAWGAFPAGGETLAVSLPPGSSSSPRPAQVQGNRVLTFTPVATVYLPVVLHDYPLPGSGGGSNVSCNPGGQATDPAGDASLPHVDILRLDSSLSAGWLSAYLTLSDVPNHLTFNRTGLGEGAREYEWSVMVDVDDSIATGAPGGPYIGADYMVSAVHFVDLPNSPTPLTILDGTDAAVWMITPGGFTWYSSAVLEVDPAANTLHLIGYIPGITTTSVLRGYAVDANPGGSGEVSDLVCPSQYWNRKGGENRQRLFPSPYLHLPLRLK
ncbi:MAG: hypothetical protein D6796_17005 [Caldilineae bacterium]|nr:MAG: hypothetical protein D6796_17005 [Caldilineae bacterium]